MSTSPLSPVVNLTNYFLHKQVDSGLDDHLAIIQDLDPCVTYRQLQSLTHQAGNGLKARGAQPGDRVMIALNDGPEFAATLFGACQIGAIAVMVNPTLHENIPALAAEAGASLVIGDPTHHLVAFRDLVNGQSTELDIHPTRASDDAIWLYSGGTTKGRQKLVRQRHGSYVAVTEYLAKSFMGYRPDDKTLSVPRLFFGYATGGNLLFPLAVGATAVLSSDWPTAKGIFDQVRWHRPTILINTPAMIKHMLDYAAKHRDECDLSSVRLMTSAGERLPPSLYEQWVKVFPQTPLCDGLGFAEHWYFASLNRPGEIRPGTVGKIIPGLDVKICDESGRELAMGEEGYLWVRGPALANGYHNNPEATAAAFRDGWFVPGDLARLVVDEKDGHPRLIYGGRSGNTFKVSGQWVNGDEVADCLLQHPAIAECAVLSYEDPTTGLAKPAAFVVLKAGSSATDRELREHVVAQLPGYNCPQRFIFPGESLPRTPLGKVNLAELKQKLG